MSEVDSTQRGDEKSVADAAARQPQPDDWDRRVVPLLWFLGTEFAVREMLNHWLPSYLSIGIAFFIAGLVVISVLDSRRSHYSFDKRLAYGLLTLASVSVSLLHLPFDAVPSYLSLGIVVFIAGLALFRFRGPRWVRYGFVKWVALWLLISASVSSVVFLLSALLSKAINR
jgi:hypothetical protein